MMQLTKNFHLNELLHSDHSLRIGGRLLAEQRNPAPHILENLKQLVYTTLQPLRDYLNTSIHITSGYRCPALNKRIGGSVISQHLQGLAADLKVSQDFFSKETTQGVIAALNKEVECITGKKVSKKVNSNFYLFAAACLMKEELKVDQLIHEHGQAGRPDWVHISMVEWESRGQILKIDSRGVQKLSVSDALSLGC